MQQTLTEIDSNNLIATIDSGIRRKRYLAEIDVDVDEDKEDHRHQSPVPHDDEIHSCTSQKSYKSSSPVIVLPLRPPTAKEKHSKWIHMSIKLPNSSWHNWLYETIQVMRESVASGESSHYYISQLKFHIFTGFHWSCMGFRYQTMLFQ